MTVNVAMIVPNMNELDVLVQTSNTIEEANALVETVRTKLSPDCLKAAVFLIGDSNVESFVTLIKDNYHSLSAI